MSRRQEPIESEMATQTSPCSPAPPAFCLKRRWQAFFWTHTPSSETSSCRDRGLQRSGGPPAWRAQLSGPPRTGAPGQGSNVSLSPPMPAPKFLKGTLCCLWESISGWREETQLASMQRVCAPCVCAVCMYRVHVSCVCAVCMCVCMGRVHGPCAWAVCMCRVYVPCVCAVCMCCACAMCMCRPQAPRLWERGHQVRFPLEDCGAF